MSDFTIIVLISVGFALIFGPRVAQSANRREPIYGGLPAQILNLIGSMSFVALVPSVLAGLILGEVHQAVPLAIGQLLTSLIAMVLFAWVELPARSRLAPAQPTTSEDEVWTAEKARTSGL